MQHMKRVIVFCIVFALVFSACGPGQAELAARNTAETAAAIPPTIPSTNTSIPTDTATPLPTDTPTPVPIDTPTRSRVIPRRRPTHPRSHPHPDRSHSSMISPLTAEAGKAASCVNGKMADYWLAHYNRHQISTITNVRAVERQCIIRSQLTPPSWKAR
jgi:hypothetical protein